ncbi:reverse transcriptase domain-containing protein [Tanacetum coccineum]
MPPRMTTRSAGRLTVAPRAKRIGRQTGRGGGRMGEPTDIVGGRTGDQDGQVTEGDVRNVSVNNSRGGCSYKEFLACNPKDYNGNGGAIAYTHWTEKIESVQDMSGCRDNQKVKYTAGSFISKALPWWNTQVQTRGREAAVGMTWEDFKALMRVEFYLNNEMQNMETEFGCHAMVRAGYAAYTDRFHELPRLVPHLVTPENKWIERYIYGLSLQIHGMVAAIEPTIIQSAILKARVLTDEAIRNGSLKKNTKKRGNGGEPSRDGNVRDDNKISRTGRAFASTTNPVRKEYTGSAPKWRGLEWLNRAPGQGGNRPNQAMAIEGGQGRGNNGNQARGTALVMGVEEAHQDPNIMIGTVTP